MLTKHLSDDKWIAGFERPVDSKQNLWKTALNCHVRIRKPDAAGEAVGDVVSLRGLKYMFMVLAHRRKSPGDPTDFDRALAKVINVNGGIARVVEHGARRTKRRASELAKRAG